MIDRVHRELTIDEIKRITDTYHNWRGDGSEDYQDVAGFCKSVSTEDIKLHQFILGLSRFPKRKMS